MKESIQLQYNSSTMQGKWPSDEDCPEFKSTAREFMRKCNQVSYQVMRLFALGLQLPDTEWFTKIHDIEQEDSMSTLRCILYHDTHGVAPLSGHWRAGSTLQLVPTLMVELTPTLTFLPFYSNVRDNLGWKFVLVVKSRRRLLTGTSGLLSCSLASTPSCVISVTC